ncbi:MAG TPA: hypothetical protein VJ840_17800 [Gemmatimonadaceae bacterium]|nr:hypothetical protein [Gemmatimonadaceae bacterium]
MKAGSGKHGDGVTAFAEIMREQGMTAPAGLEQSIDGALRECVPGSPEDVLRAAEKILQRVVTGECEGRESALDLLTVDALVTRALEIAAHDPQSLAEFPEIAMKRIATR